MGIRQYKCDVRCDVGQFVNNADYTVKPAVNLMNLLT